MEKALELVRFLLLVNGVTFIISRSGLFRTTRMILGRSVLFAALLYCPACTSFWVALAFSASGWWPWTPLLHALWQGPIIACGVISLVPWDSAAVDEELNELGYTNGSQKEVTDGS